MDCRAFCLLDHHAHSLAVHLDKRNKYLMLHPHILHSCLKQLQLKLPQDRADHQQNLRPCETAWSASIAQFGAEKDLLEANTLARTLAERHHVLFQSLSFLRVRPALWKEPVRIRKDRFVVVH